MAQADCLKSYYRFGYSILGPFLHGFVVWLKKSFEERELKKVFFLSRDGYLMLRAFDILQGNDKNVDGKYVYFSRNSIRRALLWKCKTFEESLKYYSPCRYTTLSELSAYYGLTEKQIKIVIPETALQWNDQIEYSTIEHNIMVRKIYDALSSEISKVSKQQYECFKSYIEQEGVHGHCAMVDIGWHGSMQKYLEEFASQTRMNITIEGFYVGHSPTNKLKGQTHGWLYDSTDSKMRKRVLCFFGVIEKLFQTQEGSTYWYSMYNGVVKPELEEYEFAGQTDYSDRLAELQKGALDYVNDNRQNSPGKEPWKKLIQFGTSPTLEQTKLFRFLCNMDGVKTYFLPQKGLFSYGLREFIYALSNSAWKTGFMKNAFKLPLPYYQVYKLMRK